jgi:hypothetical protein
MSSSLNKEISKNVVTTLKKKLGLPESKSLPTEYEEIVQAAIKEVEHSATSRFVRQQAISAAKQFYRDSEPKAAIETRLSAALDGVTLVGRSDELKQMIKENANMLFAKKKALEDAGFSSEQAFQLILAEVSAKKAK